MSEPVPGPEPLAGARVAVVQPPASGGGLTAALRDAGCAVSRFASSGEALVPALDGRFDAVLAPLHGEGLDGPTLCKALRERLGASVVLLLLGQGGEREAAVMRGLDAGADDCLLPPVPADLLRAKLRIALVAASSVTRPVVAVPPALRPSPPCELDGYRLRRVLGAGAYGTVYEARRAGDGRPVALKLLCRDVSEDPVHLARFVREVEALAEVHSPHVAPVLGAGWVHGHYYLLMDLVQGLPASRIVDGDGRARVDQVVGLARDMCLAIEALAARGLVHRDLKPSNIIVREDGRATLVDFGLVKRREDEGVTGPGELTGTPAYLAPETIGGRPQDTASDLYALGVTLWELLAGFRPFSGLTERHLLETIASAGSSVEVARLRPEVPPRLSWLIARLMEPDPERRLRDPRAARRALDDVAADLRPGAGKPSRALDPAPGAAVGQR